MGLSRVVPIVFVSFVLANSDIIRYNLEARIQKPEARSQKPEARSLNTL
jgi:hypothetical protein